MAKGKKTDEPEDHIAAHEAALERLVNIALEAEFTSGTLVGDIRDAMLDLFKNRPSPWSQLSEIEQRDTVKGLENIAKTVVRKTVLVVAEEDLASVEGTLKGYSAKGGLFKLTVEANGDVETAEQLFQMDGHTVVIMSADATRFTGQRKDADVQPDQAALGFSDPDAPEPPPADDSDLVDAAEEDEEPSPTAVEGPVSVEELEAES